MWWIWWLLGNDLRLSWLSMYSIFKWATRVMLTVGYIYYETVHKSHMRACMETCSPESSLMFWYFWLCGYFSTKWTWLSQRFHVCLKPLLGPGTIDANWFPLLVYQPYMVWPLSVPLYKATELFHAHYHALG